MSGTSPVLSALLGAVHGVDPSNPPEYKYLLQHPAKPTDFLRVHFTRQGNASPWNPAGLLRLGMSRGEVGAMGHSPRACLCPQEHPQGQHSRVCNWLGKHPVPTTPCPSQHPIPAHPAIPDPKNPTVHIQGQTFVPRGSHHVW